jgi:molybdopterin-binding protein
VPGEIAIPADATMCSVMTLDSLDELGLKPGSKVNVIAKAVNVLLTSE